MKFSMIQNAQYTKPSPLKDGESRSQIRAELELNFLSCPRSQRTYCSTTSGLTRTSSDLITSTDARDPLRRVSSSAVSPRRSLPEPSFADGFPSSQNHLYCSPDSM